MKKKASIAIILIVGILIGFTLYSKSTNKEPEKVIEETSVGKGDIIIEMVADGNVSMPQYVQYFETDGILGDLYFEVGDVVKAGDVVAMLKNEDLKLEVRQRELSLESDKIQVSDTARDNAYLVDLQNVKIIELKIQIEDAQDDIDIMSMYPDLYPLKDRKDREKDLELAKRELTNVNDYISVLRSNDTDKNNMMVAQADVELKIALNKLEKTILISEFDGIVVGIQSEKGSKVSDNEAFVTIAQEEHPLVISHVSELDIYQVEKGQKVYVELESDLGMQYEGMVSFINPIPKVDSNGIVSYEVEIDLLNKPASFMEGMTVLIKYVLKERLSVLIIPNNTVRIVNGEQFVDVKRDESIEAIKIFTGLTDGMQVEVLKGLEEKDVLIIQSN